MARFRLTHAAANDLREIRDFLARRDLAAARAVLDELEQALRELAEMPELGHRRPDLTDANLRFWRVFDYLVVYDAYRHPIVVVRVLHGRRDVGAELRAATRS